MLDLTHLSYDAILRRAYTATEVPEFTPEQLDELAEPFDSDRHERLMPVPLPIQHLLASYMELEALHEGFGDRMATIDHDDEDARAELAADHAAVCPKRKKVMGLIETLIKEAVGDISDKFVGVGIVEDMQLAGVIGAEESDIDIPPELGAAILAALMGREGGRRDGMMVSGVIIG